MGRIRDSGNRRAGCLITPYPTQTAISEKRLRNQRKTPTKSLNRINTNQPTVTTQNLKCVFKHLGTEIRSRVFASGEFISTRASSSRSRQKKRPQKRSFAETLPHVLVSRTLRKILLPGSAEDDNVFKWLHKEKFTARTQHHKQPLTATALCGEATALVAPCRFNDE